MFFLINGGVATAATLGGLALGTGLGLAAAAAYHGSRAMEGGCPGGRQ